MAPVRFVWRSLFILLGIVLVLVLGAVAYRGWRQQENARYLAIETPNGIREGSFVPIGRLEQWIQIRGDDRSNPIILMLHGGPGGSMGAFTTLFRPWEKDFTIVQWDQRGSGRTYGRHGESGQGEMTIARMTNDGIEVAEYLRRRLKQQKIIVLGHSWGTVLGVLMVKQRPDLFSAYIGTGQVVAKEEKEEIIYDALLKKVRAANDEEAITALEQIGRPPYASQDELLIQRHWLQRYDIPSERDIESNLAPVVLFSPNYSLTDIYNMLNAPKFAAGRIYNELIPYDARKLGLHFEVPFFIIQGEEDSVTPTNLARAYFDSVDAPVKEFVTIKDAGHSALLTKSDEFLRDVLDHVLPVVAESDTANFP